MLLATLKPVIRIATATAVLLALVWTGSAGAASLQQVGVFDQPIHVASSPTDPDRLFVAERRGKVVEVRGGAVSLLADLTPVVGCCAGETGLLSIAIAPDFDTSGRFYAFYTGLEGEIRVGELTAGPAGAPISSLRPVLQIPHPGHDNHYGGQLQFGPEGLLYVSTGDGGGQNDEGHNAQNPKSLLGKILRIDPRPAGLAPYSIPPGNPFAAAPWADPAIWSLGLRNPYRFTFDREGGAIAIGDVGQGSREEVDYAPGPAAGIGVNYGWNCVEGTLPGPATDPQCANPPPGGFTAPLFDYGHSDPGIETRCAIVGGYVVRDRALGDLYGRYLYGDFCGLDLRSFDPANPRGTDRPEYVGLGPELTSFGEDSCGRLYTAQATGRVSMLVGENGANACKVAAPRQLSIVGIKAQSRKVKKRKRAQITAWVSPCAGRRGEPVKLMRGRKHLGTRHLDRACTVRFRPRITRRTNFRATIAEDANYVAATSRKLRVLIRHKAKNNKQRKHGPR
jgi:hypothetical protein